MSEEDSGDECLMPPNKNWKEGIVALFKTLVLNEDYTTAIDFSEDSFEYSPTPSVINDIIFKIMINCDENLANKAADYLEGSLGTMSSHEDQKSDFLKALKDESCTKPDVWDAFSHFVWSCLYSCKVTEVNHSDKEFVKSPNCDLLVHLYVKAFLNCSIKSDVLGTRAEERISCLLKWISLYYKYNCANEAVLGSLHNLLGYIVDSEISSDPSLPPCVKVHTVNLSPYMNLILNICKDIFAAPEKQQRFFNYTMSYYLIVKVCQYRLHELIDEPSLPKKPGMLTLKSIVDTYFFKPISSGKSDSPHTSGVIKTLKIFSKDPLAANLMPTKKSSGKSDSPRTSGAIKKLKKFSKDPLPGDTKLHEHCRLGKPADLLMSLSLVKGDELNIKNSAGNTPLHEACLSSSFICCQFLADESQNKKLDYKATENGGRTPLHCAVYVNALDIAKFLLANGGNDLVLCQDDWGKKPIDYSTSSDMTDMLKRIESELENNRDKESQESSISTQLQLPNLKNAEDFHLYLQTLRSLVSNYCEIYDLPKNETDVIALSHDRKECYHYKPGPETLCTEDSIILKTFSTVIKKFISCGECVSKEKLVKKELFHWKTQETVFK